MNVAKPLSEGHRAKVNKTMVENADLIRSNKTGYRLGECPENRAEIY